MDSVPRVSSRSGAQHSPGFESPLDGPVHLHRRGAFIPETALTPREPMEQHLHRTQQMQLRIREICPALLHQVDLLMARAGGLAVQGSDGPTLWGVDKNSPLIKLEEQLANQLLTQYIKSIDTGMSAQSIASSTSRDQTGTGPET